MTPEFTPVGDLALRVAFGVEISPRINAHVRRFCHRLEAEPVRGVTEWVPGYATVTVYYRPWEVGYDALRGGLARRTGPAGGTPPAQARRVEIPVCYGGEYGPDLSEVAAAHGLAPTQVIERHAGGDYLVYFLGFCPASPIWADWTHPLRRPDGRRRARISSAGSVGIAGAQTGVYPLETPGGWQIIGRTPLRLYDPARQPPALLAAGDRVLFVAITENQFEEAVEAVNGPG